MACGTVAFTSPYVSTLLCANEINNGTIQAACRTTITTPSALGCYSDDYRFACGTMSSSVFDANLQVLGVKACVCSATIAGNGTLTPTNAYNGTFCPPHVCDGTNKYVCLNQLPVVAAGGTVKYTATTFTTTGQASASATASVAGNHNDNKGVIAGSVIVAFAFLAAIAGLMYWYIRRRRRNRAQAAVNPFTDESKSSYQLEPLPQIRTDPFMPLQDGGDLGENQTQVTPSTPSRRSSRKAPPSFGGNDVGDGVYDYGMNREFLEDEDEREARNPFADPEAGGVHGTPPRAQQRNPRAFPLSP